ncbi:hypothetical protein DB346_01205 [Verrucomicrobia bacterium LW23]|nr:hypothetical protein DB346_01205 [Verrucomicrobia bacterium LW23]
MNGSALSPSAGAAAVPVAGLPRRLWSNATALALACRNLLYPPVAIDPAAMPPRMLGMTMCTQCGDLLGMEGLTGSSRKRVKHAEALERARKASAASADAANPPQQSEAAESYIAPEAPILAMPRKVRIDGPDLEDEALDWEHNWNPDFDGVADTVVPDYPQVTPQAEAVPPPSSPSLPPPPRYCESCETQLRKRDAYSYQWARAAYPAVGAVREAVIAFKYHGLWHLRGTLADWLELAYTDHALPRSATWDGLVPVPLHSVRRYWRQFNQAQELACELGRRRNIPLLPCLRRVRYTGTQTRLTHAQRRANMLDAFDLRPGSADLHGRRLLLIDDVFTTGATCESCARVLRAHGAAEVGVLTVGRG